MCFFVFSLLFLFSVQSPTFEDFWNRKATKWEFLNEHKFVNAMNVGTQFVTIGNVWYLFHRVYFDQKYPGCEHRDNAKVVVKRSVDKGKTWTNETDVGLPDRGSIWLQCAVVDGGGYYDEETTTWHYLSQCLGTQAWCLCHYYRKDKSPIGPWTKNSRNPVIKGGDLWRKICGGEGKHCSNGTVDEGTPDIVEKVNGEFFVTFHGFDYVKKLGARGVAATKDFVKWRVDGDLLPNDAIFTSLDCNPWNIHWDPTTGCIGGGEGSILEEGGYKYQLIEAPDLTLACDLIIGEQNWVLGLSRSKTWSRSGTWEQFDVNPTIIPYRKRGCSLQYHRIFKDTEGVYLSYWIYGDKSEDYWMQTYQLVDGQGDLPIVAKPYKHD